MCPKSQCRKPLEIKKAQKKFSVIHGKLIVQPLEIKQGPTKVLNNTW